MKKLSLLAALALGGCTTLQAIGGFAVTQSQLDAARASYDGAFLAPAAHYRQLPLCAKGQTFLRNQCRTHALVVKLQQADRSVAIGFDKTQQAITAGDNTGAVGAFQELKALIGVSERILSDNGIQ